MEDKGRTFIQNKKDLFEHLYNNSEKNMLSELNTLLITFRSVGYNP